MSFMDNMKNAAQKGLDAAKSAQAARPPKQPKDWKEGIMQLKSLEGSVTLYEDRIEIKNLLGSKSRVIPYTQIHAVNLDKTSGLAKGTAAVLTGGVSLAVTNKKRLVINAGNESVGLEFRVESLGEIKRAMALMNERIKGNRLGNVTVNMAGNTPAAAPTQNASAADELTKLAKLKDDGIITQAEFDTKKKQLLGL